MRLRLRSLPQYFRWCLDNNDDYEISYDDFEDEDEEDDDDGDDDDDGVTNNKNNKTKVTQ